MESTELAITCERKHRLELPTGVLGLDRHPETGTLFAACMDGVYQVFAPAGNYEQLYAHESYASGVVCIHEHNRLVSAGYDGALQWFDLSSRQVVRHIQAHSFWSWDLARAKHRPVVASVSGQYLAGSYEYHPHAAPEPCVRVYDGVSGALINAFNHGPPVQAVAITDDGERVAAGNLMGDAAVWQIDGEQAARWNTPDFTAFGIIKSHCQIGGIYATAFAPNQDLLVAGMGPMRDPMAGNGKQRWQRFDWRVQDGEASANKVSASKDDQVGEGLIETMAVHPSGRYFVMAGRLRGGSWNVGFFDLESGDLIHSFKNGIRVTKAVFSEDGKQLYLAGAKRQPKEPDKSFGIIDVHELSAE